MAGHWTLRDTPSTAHVSTAAVARLLQDLALRSVGDAALRFLGTLAPLDYLSLVKYGADGPPRQVEGQASSWAKRQTPVRCFALYRSRFYRHDEAIALAAELRAADPDAPRVEVLHYGQRDIPEPAWRDEIFVRERLAGRVGLMFGGSGGQAYALNLYRDVAAGEFTADELQRFCAVSAMLRVALRPQLDRLEPAAVAGRIGAMLERLDDRAPALSVREREVAARIACGLSNDGIAADLDVAPSTVQTLRKRLYAKLGIHSRIALVWLLR